MNKLNENLASLWEEYRPKDIFSMDETGLYFRVPNIKLFFKKSNVVFKKSKIVLVGKNVSSLCLSKTKEKVKSLIIWKYNNLWCIRSIKKEEFISQNNYHFLSSFCKWRAGSRSFWCHPWQCFYNQMYFPVEVKKKYLDVSVDELIKWESNSQPEMETSVTGMHKLIKFLMPSMIMK